MSSSSRAFLLALAHAMLEPMNTIAAQIAKKMLKDLLSTSIAAI
jgi:hypothetical protein